MRSHNSHSDNSRVPPPGLGAPRDTTRSCWRGYSRLSSSRQPAIQGEWDQQQRPPSWRIKGELTEVGYTLPISLIQACQPPSGFFRISTETRARPRQYDNGEDNNDERENSLVYGFVRTTSQPSLPNVQVDPMDRRRKNLSNEPEIVLRIPHRGADWSQRGFRVKGE